MEPISYFQAIILGALQGIAEPFPISSLGHAVIAPSLFGWNIHQNDEFFLAFLVATHCATAIVLFFFFLEDWKRIFRGLGRSLRGRSTPDDTDARLGWVIVIGTIPAGILGLALEHKLRDLFASPEWGDPSEPSGYASEPSPLRGSRSTHSVDREPRNGAQGAERTCAVP